MAAINSRTGGGNGRKGREIRTECWLTGAICPERCARTAVARHTEESAQTLPELRLKIFSAPYVDDGLTVNAQESSGRFNLFDFAYGGHHEYCGDYGE